MRHAVVEVMQSSTMDCGPAALSSLLRSQGAPGNYDALRDLCATDVDGTSIGSLAAVAGAVGLDAAELMVPLDHLEACPDRYLPAIGVTLLPDGFTHFVVLWRPTRRGLEVMDPAVGRRRLSARHLATDLYRHAQAVPASAWRDWAGSEPFLDALDRRLRRLGVEPTDAQALMDEATSDPGVEGLASLDGALRALASTPGPDPARRIRALLTEGVADADRCCVPIPPQEPEPTDPADEPMVELHGVVLVRAGDWDPTAADPHLMALLDAPDPPHWQVLARNVPRGRTMALALAGAAALVAVIAVIEALVLEDLVASSGPDQQHWWAVPVLVASAAVLIATLVLSRLIGRAAEEGVRRAWWHKVSVLPATFTRTRPASDLAERGHLLHRLRDLPIHADRALVGAGIVLASAIGIVTLQPQALTPVGILVLSAVVGPILAFRSVAEADLRARTISGTLTRFTIDALIGGDVVVSGRAAASVTHEHERSLVSWRHAMAASVRRSAHAQGCSAVVAAAAAGWVLSSTDAGRPSEVLAIALLALLVVDGGRAVAGSLATLPLHRSLLARVAGPLASAPDARAPADTPVVEGVEGAAAGQVPPVPGIALSEVTVAHGGAVALDAVTLSIEPGEHVALVGASGAGKSTLLDVILGITEPTSGSVRWSPTRPAAAQVAWVAPGTRLWNDSIEANADYGADHRADAAPSRLDAAGVGDLADRLSARPDPRLGSSGGMLSDGEAQRVRVARALGRPDATLVVLDEPFRGLEAHRRATLLADLRATWPLSTLVCAMHEVSETLSFDRVIVLEHGRVVANGTPAALMDDPDSPLARLVERSRRAPWDGWQIKDLLGVEDAVR